MNLLGDANAAHDIVIDGKNGSFNGIGQGITAGHDVRMTAGDSINYIGTAQKSMHAGHDIDLQVTNPGSEHSGIYIGALSDGTPPNPNVTSLEAGNTARFDVQGDGNITLGGNIVAQNGDVTANISGEGSVVITGSVESRNQSVSVETG